MAKPPSLARLWRFTATQMAFNLLFPFTITHMHHTLWSLISLTLESDLQWRWAYQNHYSSGDKYPEENHWSRNLCCLPLLTHHSEVPRATLHKLKKYLREESTDFSLGKREIFQRKDNDNSLTDKLYFKMLCFPVDIKYRPNSSIK